MDQPKRGFAKDDNAAKAARKNWTLGTAHRFDAKQGRAAVALRKLIGGCCAPGYRRTEHCPAE